MLRTPVGLIKELGSRDYTYFLLNVIKVREIEARQQRMQTGTDTSDTRADPVSVPVCIRCCLLRFHGRLLNHLQNRRPILRQLGRPNPFDAPQLFQRSGA